MHRSSSTHIPFRSAVLAGIAGPLVALVIGAGAVVAAETGPYAGSGGFSPPSISSLAR
jgi:hypothetical protein